MNVSGRRIVVTGGSGFLGRRVVAELHERGAAEVVAPRKRDYDLVEREACRRLVAETRPDVVIHLAARVGGIGANRENPGAFFYDNLMMGVHLIEEAAWRACPSSSASAPSARIPSSRPVPFREESLWDGYPEETNAPYGLAKKMLLVQGQAYRQQYGMNAIYLLPVNLYGPGDNFDPASSHVIPALIKKVQDAQDAGAGVDRGLGDGQRVPRVPLRRRRRRGDRAGHRALRRRGAGEPRRGLRDQDPRPRGADRRLTGFRGELRWDDAEAGRPAPPLPGHVASGAPVRLPRDDVLRGGAQTHRRVVRAVAASALGDGPGPQRRVRRRPAITSSRGPGRRKRVT